MRVEKRILIVDDDDAIRALLVTVLRRRGYRLDMARNGLEAVEKLVACSYELIVLDLMMPRMNGYELLDWLRSLPEDARPLVLVLTAGLEARKFDNALVIGTMAKPFDIELLVDTIAGCLTTRSGRPQHEECPETLESADGREQKAN